MKNRTTISIDLAKKVFQVAVFNRHGTLKSNRAMNREKMLALIAQHPEAQICMEACSSAHYFGRLLEERGHKVYLLPPSHCARFRTGNKNDPNDVLAIYQALHHPTIHFVPIRTVDQQDLAMLHKLRKGYVDQRTQLANRIRGFAVEYGVIFPIGLVKLRCALMEALEDGDNALTPLARATLYELYEQINHLDKRIKQANHQIQQTGMNNPLCRSLQTLPGVGWLVATMLYVRFGDGRMFRRGRDASASIGIVPGHQGSGGINRLGKISKRGDKYLRWLVISGARAVVSRAQGKTDGLSRWIQNQLANKHFNNTTVAYANKLVRMAIAILKSGQSYQAPVAQVG